MAAFKILVRLADGDRYIASKTFRLKANAAPLKTYDRLIEAAEKETK